MLLVLLCGAFLGLASDPKSTQAADPGLDICEDYSLTPPFLTGSAPPLVMLVMSRDHTLYNQAYDDASDIDGDGELDIGYDPAIDYYGYFNSHACYTYDKINKQFEPHSITEDKTCDGSNWSGDFLNYLTTSRIDAIRKVLYGGKRSTDSSSETVLERAFIPKDAHSWGKEYSSYDEEGYYIHDYTPYSEPADGKRHLFASTSEANLNDHIPEDIEPLLRVKKDTSDRVWDWVAVESGNNEIAHDPDDEFEVRVRVCEAGMEEDNCKDYSGDSKKPVGLLQRYGEPNRIYFGLLTGSYEKHLSGGILRKNIESITNEISNSTGEFLYQDDDSIGGIVKTMDTMTFIDIDDHGKSNHGHLDTIYNGPITEGQNRMWGNPISEMVFEAVRYFQGQKSPSSEYDFTYNNSRDDDLGLPGDMSWIDPYVNYEYCAKPIILTISDINPSYDTDQLPGIAGEWQTGSYDPSLDLKTELDEISSHEGISSGDEFFIGETVDSYDTACTAKSLVNDQSLADLRGLCPREPTKQGGYYGSAVAKYGHSNDMHDTAQDDQLIDFYSVALSSPLPEIKVEVGGGEISILPFAKTVNATSGGGVDPDGDFQPTCAITDFHVESLNATKGSFLVYFEHAEQGSDYDKDAIVRYSYTVTDNDELELNATCLEFDGGSSIQHLGFIISGTENDGPYLPIRSTNKNADDNDQHSDYFLDTVGNDTPYPDNVNWDDDERLPTSWQRTFTPSNSSPANLLKDPLWYMAKWGGFVDRNNNGFPDGDEWDSDGDGDPDTYYFVNNPTKLEARLNQAFASILKRLSAGSAASVVSGARSGEGALYQAVFWPNKFDDASNEVTWTGDVHALLVNSEGNLYEDTNQNGTLDAEDQRAIIYFDESEERSVACIGGKVVNGTCNSTVTELEDVNYLWSAADWLRQPSLDTAILQNRLNFISGQDRRLLFTWYDTDQDGIVDYDGTENIGNGEVLNFLESDLSSVNATDICNGTVINWVRGQDQTGMRSRLYSDGGDTYWRLGDVIHSTPVAVGRPAENYDLLWGDETYTPFYRKYRKRRNVIYFGSNDGILHAVNGGFYSPSDKGYFKEYDSTDGYTNPSTGVPDLGAELWGYIPYNLLPHLECLTDQDYEHKYFVDLHPRVFDVRIWEDEWNDVTGTHPNGWGTILVCGMRFGGSHVEVGSRDFSSSYMIFDVTDPEQDPVLMGEVTYDYDDSTVAQLGYTLSVPSVLPVTNTSGMQRWYLVLGSGPDAVSIDLSDAASTQNAKLAVIPLNELASSGFSLQIPDALPTATTAGVHELPGSNSTSFVDSDLVAVDHDFDFLTDMLYFGTVAGFEAPWGGGIYRMKIHDKNNNATLDDPGLWGVHKLIDADVPVTGTPNVGSHEGQIWVYCGTGRFLTADDSRDNSTQYFFGIKEPKDENGYTFNSVSKPDNDSPDFAKWIKSSDILVKDSDGTLVCSDGGSSCYPSEVSNFYDLEEHCVTNSTYGWFRELNATERVVGQPTLLGGLVNYTAYTPDQSLCTSEGSSTLHSVYYLTGTSWTENVFGESNAGDTVDFTKDLGRGLSITPTMHLGSQKGGKLVIQTSTGEIKEIHQSNLPIKNVHSGKSSWHTHDIE